MPEPAEDDALIRALRAEATRGASVGIARALRFAANEKSRRGATDTAPSNDSGDRLVAGRLTAPALDAPRAVT